MLRKLVAAAFLALIASQAPAGDPVIVVAGISRSITPQLGGGIGFGFDGGISGNGKTTPPPPGCASPTAPNGVVDLSQCSNAFYAAVIF